MKKLNKYIHSQSGAALLLVLFVVVFLSITGAVLLNTTTYSTRSINQNEIKENRFYILEGALELALFDLYTTNDYYGGSEDLKDYEGKQVFAPDGKTPLQIHKKGIYFFIQDYLIDQVKPEYQEVLGNVFIDGHEIMFTLEKSKVKDTYELSAEFVDDYKLHRTLYLEFIVPEKPVEYYNGVSIFRNNYIQSPIELLSNDNIHKNRKPLLKGKYLGNIDFEVKKKEYELSVPRILNDLTPDTIINKSPAYYKNITASNKEIITIPEGKVVYANSLDWTGQNRTLIVKGVLIIDNFHMQSSGKLEIESSGTVIAKNFGIGSNSPALVFGSETGGSESGKGTPQYITDVDWIANSYTITDYRTGHGK